jgi:hypothetical protein
MKHILGKIKNIVFAVTEIYQPNWKSKNDVEEYRLGFEGDPIKNWK